MTHRWNQYERYNTLGSKKKYFKKHPEKLAELYRLSDEGWGCVRLAQRYGLHHSSILAQLKRRLFPQGGGERISRKNAKISADKPIVIQAHATTFVDPEGVRNKGHDYAEYLAIEADRKWNYLLNKGKPKS